MLAGFPTRITQQGGVGNFPSGPARLETGSVERRERQMAGLAGSAAVWGAPRMPKERDHMLILLATAGLMIFQQ